MGIGGLAVADAQKGSASAMRLARASSDYRVTTAEIIYHLPDHPNVLQSYIWQDLDVAPRFPVLHRFLDFWTRELEGTLHSVRLASGLMVMRPQVRHADGLFTLH
jgi:uncharacterized protein Usg